MIDVIIVQVVMLFCVFVGVLTFFVSYAGVSTMLCSSSDSVEPWRWVIILRDDE